MLTSKQKAEILIENAIIESRSVSYEVQSVATSVGIQILMDLSNQEKEKIDKNIYKIIGQIQSDVFGEIYTINYQCYEIHHGAEFKLNIGAETNISAKQINVIFAKIDNKTNRYILIERIEGNKILVGGRTTELTLVENPTVDDRCESNLKSSDLLKQEVKTEIKL